MKYIDLLNEVWHIRFSCLPFSREKGTLTKGTLLATLKKISSCHRDVYPYDHVPFYYKSFGHESFTSLLTNVREVQKREYISTPVNKVKGRWGSRAINKIVKTPGKDIHQKIAHVKTVEINKSVYTPNSLENRALVECVRKLLPLLKERDDLSHLYKELKRRFRKSELGSQPEMGTKQPNSKLMYDVHYRKIWIIYNWLTKLDNIRKRDEANIIKNVSQTLYLKILSELVYQFNLIVPDEVLDFSKDIETSTVLLSYTVSLFYNIKFSVKVVGDTNIDITLNNYKESINIGSQNILDDSYIDSILDKSLIQKISKTKSFDREKANYVLPYLSVDSKGNYISYYENGFQLNPQIPFAVKNRESIEPFTLINDPSKMSRIKALQGINSKTVSLIADSLEADDYYNLTDDQLPMSVALGLGRIKDMNEGESISFLNYFSNPVSLTHLTIKLDEKSGHKYFLRSIPQDIKDLTPIADLFKKVSDCIGLELGSSLSYTVMEYLLKHNYLYLYNSKKRQWEKFTKPEIPIIEKIDSDILITHPLLQDQDLEQDFIDGVIEYKHRVENQIPIWKEEVISFEMYMPDNAAKQITKITLVDQNNTSLDPIRGKKQLISRDNLTFTIPGGKDKAIVPLLYNNEGIKYATVSLNPPFEEDLNTKIKLIFTYGDKEPYSLDFVSLDGERVYRGELSKRVTDDSVNLGIPECPIINVSLNDIKNTQKSSQFKYFSSNYKVIDDAGVEYLDNLAEKTCKKFNEKNEELQENDKSICKLGDYVEDEYWISLIDEIDDYSGLAYKIRRRYAVAMSKEFREVFIKRLLSNKYLSKFDDLWGLSYAVWYNQDLLNEYFDSKEKCKELNTLLDLVVKGFTHIETTLEENQSISNFSSLLLLAAIKLRKSPILEIREMVSLSNPKMQQILFKVYDYDYAIGKTRKQLGKNNKEILYSDGFNIELNEDIDPDINGMEKHNYLIHKYLNGDNPLITVDIKG